MTKEEAIARIKRHKVVHKLYEPRAIYISEALDMAIEALENSQNCVKCIHYYENEDDTGVHSQCTIGKLHDLAEKAENSEVRKGILQAIEIIKGVDE